MKFWSFYSKRLIAGIPKEELTDILSNRREGVSTKIINNGSILVSGELNKVIKCVSEYYEPAGESDVAPMKSSNAMIKCQNTRDRLKVSAARMDCLHCHRLCMRMHDENRLKRKESK